MVPMRQALRQADEPQFSQRDVVMILALASGRSNAEVADYLGLSQRGLYKWYASHRERIRPLADALAAWFASSKNEMRREIIENLTDEIKNLDGLSRDAWVKALTGKDMRLAYEASREQRDRRLGTPVSSVRHSGKLEHDHLVTHTIDPAVLSAFERDVLRDASLARPGHELEAGSPDHVIDVTSEPVDPDPAG
jgi:hypothetical protein